MRMVLSRHAKERLVERGIQIQDVERTIEMPDYIISKGNKKEAYKKWIIKF
ncbi:MAG: DUF4258 domain-containing protein [archaeon]